MNEQQTAFAIRRELETGTRELPDDVTARLDQARMAAMSAMPKPKPATRAVFKPEAASTFGLIIDRPPLFSRFALAVAPIVMVAFGLVSVSQWNNERRIQEIAEIDSALLLDDMPIAVYADKGFGVFLVNTRQ